MNRISFFLLLLLFFQSCTNENKPALRIGFSQCTMGDSWRINQWEAMRRELSFFPELSLDLKDANGNTQKQIQDVKQMIEEGYDLIIISPNDYELSTAIDLAYSAGIPVLILDRRTASTNYTAFVGAENTQVGEQAGNYAHAITTRPNTQIVEVIAGSTDSPAIDRHKGFTSAITSSKNLVTSPAIYSGDNDSVKIQKELAKIPAVDIIFAHNDRLAWTVSKVCKKMGISPKIIGVDGLAGENEGLDLVRKGLLEATVLYPSGGEEAIKVANAILKRMPFQRENNLFSTVINKDNVNIMFSQYQKIKAQQEDIERQASRIQELNLTFSTQRNRLYITSALLTVVVLLLATLYFLLQEKQRSNRVLEQQNKAIQEQKNQIEKVSQLAQKAVEDKMRFYSYISHEFRTPLSLILTPTEDQLAQKNISPQEAKQTFQLIRKNAHRLLRLVDQFLELRQLDAGKMQLESRDLDLVAFLKEIVHDFQPKAQAQKIDLQFFSPFSGFMYAFDAEKLDKVFFNVISNAFKYTSEGGFIHISLARKADQVVIQFADSGVGMTEEEKTHAFDLFYRGNKNISLGTGLGLALSREFVLLHEGEIYIESEKNKGTTFTIHLPVRIQIPTSQDSNEVPMFQKKERFSTWEMPIQDVQTSNSAEHSILIIEDNRDLNRFLSQKFAKTYHVFSAETAEKGWDILLQNIPDVVLCDVMLPGMDGYQLTQKIKADFRTSHIPVILLTAKSHLENQLEGTKAGADDYLTKPFHQELVEQKVKNCIESRERQRKKGQQEVHQPAGLQRHEKVFFTELDRLIEKNLADNSLSVEKLSSELGMSRVQLFRKMSALTGENVSDYIASFKTNKAKVLLQDANRNITEIAYDLGFSNPSYFTTFFKQRTGHTPTEWRLKIEKEREKN